MLAPKWAHEPLSGRGAEKHGGRWNPPGTPALYMSATFVTAMAEYEQDLGIRPGTLLAYDVDAEPIADLADPAVAAQLGLESSDLIAPWKQIALVERRRPRSWDVVLALLGAGLVGARVPSTRSSGINLALWRWNIAESCRASVLDPLGDLPRTQASWRE